MKQSLSIVALAGITNARLDARQRPSGGISAEQQAFLNFQSQYNKHASTSDEQAMRLGIFQVESQAISDLNRESEEECGDGPRCLKLEMNFTGDMTQDELTSLRGLNYVDESQKVKLGAEIRGVDTLPNSSRQHGAPPTHHGRHLQSEVQSVDHVEAGFMGPVKDQGQCGSCVQFAVSSSVEGTWTKQASLASPPQFSEQHLLDCTYGDRNSKPEIVDENERLFGKNYGGYGCNGSWMRNTYQFLMEQGAVDISKKSYTASEQMCEHKAEDVVARVSNFGQVSGTVSDFKDRVMMQPVTVGINASARGFQYYKSGVLLEKGCNTQINHAVVVVGFVGGESPNPTPPDCDVSQWWHSCAEEEPSARRLQADPTDYNQDQMTNYWRIQNSWGAGWGDNGFIKFDIVDGDGVCGINNVVEWADIAL